MCICGQELHLRTSTLSYRACVCVCVLLCVVLPSDSPPCSWLKPAGAVTPLPHWSEVEPAPGLKRLEETRTKLQRDFGRME